MVASKNNHLTTVKNLLEGGALINAKDINHFTPLHFASANNNLYIISNLILNRANVNALDIDNFSPLYIAAELGHLDAVKLLLNNGALVDQTIIEMARRGGNLEIIHILVEYYNNYDDPTETQTTPVVISPSLNPSIQIPTPIPDNSENPMPNNIKQGGRGARYSRKYRHRRKGRTRRV